MPTPSTLEGSLAAHARAGSTRNSGKYQNDSLHRVPLDLLDANPWQPRASMDARELTELVDAIRAHGLIQPIAVKPRSTGRFVIVAGHRRVEAFRRLLAEATTETARQKFSTIQATLKLALDDAQLAAQAYLENVARAALTPIDEARALETMLEKGLAKTNEELATLLQQQPARIKRLRRLSAAPSIVKEAVGGGLMVTLDTDADGRDKKELRRLDLMPGLAFTRVHEHLKKTQPKKADERIEVSVRRALAGNWSFKRCDAFVDSAIAGKSAEVDTATIAVTPAALFSVSARRFVVELGMLTDATSEQLAALKAAFVELLAAHTTARTGPVQR